jgi:hypothetical protein
MLPSEFTLLLKVSQPLVVYSQLAECFGLNEAIIIQKIHWWCESNEDQEKNKSIKLHYKDGYWWCYNTYQDWNKSFSWWAERTIYRIIDNLEKSELIVSGNYNRVGFDRTKWYRVNYIKVNEEFIKHFGTKEALNPILTKWQDGSQSDTDKMAESNTTNLSGSHTDKMAESDTDNLSGPIPYITEITKKGSQETINSFLTGIGKDSPLAQKYVQRIMKAKQGEEQPIVPDTNPDGSLF